MRSWLKKKSNQWILSASFVTKPTLKQWNVTYVRRKDILRGIAPMPPKRRAATLTSTCASSHTSTKTPQLPTAAHKDGEQMALPVSPQLGEWELGLDSMAGVNVCGSKRLASNIRKGRKITIQGVNGRLTTDTWCDLLEFKECAYVPQAPNPLSLALVSDQFEVQWDRKICESTVMAPTGNYMFSRSANTTVCNLREREVMPARLERGAMSARVETKAGSKELYSTRDIAGAERARNELRQLNFPSIQTYLKMIQRNSIVGSRVTPDDVRCMVRIYGPDIASLKGKTKRLTLPSS
jgi:hypothetical protein